MSSPLTELPQLTYEDICALDAQSRYGRSEVSMQLAVRRMIARHQAKTIRTLLEDLRTTPEADVEVALGGVDWVLGWLREQADQIAARHG